MAKDYLYSAIVNQKLAFSRVELQAAASQDGDTISAKLVRHAHLDSAMAQLCTALTYFVAEVGEEYQLALDPSLKSVPAMLTEFSETGRQSAEISELLAMQKREGSWLRELLEAKANPLALAQRFKSQSEQAQTSQGFIPLVDVTRAPASAEQSSSGKNPMEVVKEWASAAQALVDRQRASLHEE